MYCSKCENELPPDAFPPSVVKRGGKSNWCRKCRAVEATARRKVPEVAAHRRKIEQAQYARNSEKRSAKQRAWRAKNPDKAKAIDRAWREKNREYIRETKVQRKLAMKVGDQHPCDHQRAEVLRSNHGLCAYCNTRPATELDHMVSLSQGGLDRLDNLMPSCRWCNVSKGKLPLLIWMASGAAQLPPQRPTRGLTNPLH